MRARLSVIIRKLLEGKPPAVVRLAAGELAWTEAELRAQWQELTQNSPLAQTALRVRMIRAEQQCMSCFEKYQPAAHETRCPRCGGAGAKMLAGEELRIESVTEEE